MNDTIWVMKSVTHCRSVLNNNINYNTYNTYMLYTTSGFGLKEITRIGEFGISF